MPPDPPSEIEPDPRAHASRVWLRKSSNDLAVSVALAANSDFAAATAFHAQQATEKLSRHSSPGMMWRSDGLTTSASCW